MAVTLKPQNTLIEDLDLTSETKFALRKSGITDTNELSKLSRSDRAKLSGLDSWSFHEEINRVLLGLKYT